MLCNTNCNLSGEAWLLLFSPCPYILLPDMHSVWVTSHESVEFHVETFNTQQVYIVFLGYFFQIMKIFIADSGNLKYFDCGHLCSTGICNWIQLEKISHLCIWMRQSLLHSLIPFLPIWQTVGKILQILSQLQRFSCYIYVCRCPHSYKAYTQASFRAISFLFWDCFYHLLIKWSQF